MTAEGLAGERVAAKVGHSLHKSNLISYFGEMKSLPLLFHQESIRAFSIGGDQGSRVLEACDG